MIAGVEAFDNALVEMRADGLIHKMAVLDNETHLSARPRAFNNGLRRLFAGDWEEDALASRTTQEVFDSHQAAIENMDIEKLMADYAEDATLLTVNGPLIGKEAILTGFFQASLEQFPDMEVTYGEVVCEDDICLLKWSAEATNGDIPVGIGALLIQDGLIQRQIEWFEVTPKED